MTDITQRTDYGLFWKSFQDAKVLRYQKTVSCPYSQRPNTLSLTLSGRSGDLMIDDTPCQDRWGNRLTWTRTFSLRYEKGTWMPCLTKTSEGDDDGRDEGIFMTYAWEDDNEGTELRRRYDHWVQRKRQGKRQRNTASLGWYRSVSWEPISYTCFMKDHPSLTWSSHVPVFDKQDSCVHVLRRYVNVLVRENRLSFPHWS